MTPPILTEALETIYAQPCHNATGWDSTQTKKIYLQDELATLNEAMLTAATEEDINAYVAVVPRAAACTRKLFG